MHYTTLQDRLSNSMELNIALETSSCVPIRELPSILWNLKVHYWISKNSTFNPVLSQLNPVHITPFYLS
jgi:hypothetical protein